MELSAVSTAWTLGLGRTRTFAHLTSLVESGSGTLLLAVEVRLDPRQTRRYLE